MPKYIDITLFNTSASQRLFFAKDLVSHQDLLKDIGTLLAPNEGVPSALAAAEDNYGRIEYKWDGGNSQTRSDVTEGQRIDMS